MFVVYTTRILYDQQYSNPPGDITVPLEFSALTPEALACINHCPARVVGVCIPGRSVLQTILVGLGLAPTLPFILG